jgi:hypothetical protein
MFGWLRKLFQRKPKQQPVPPPPKDFVTPTQQWPRSALARSRELPRAIPPPKPNRIKIVDTRPQIALEDEIGRKRHAQQRREEEEEEASSALIMSAGVAAIASELPPSQDDNKREIEGRVETGGGHFGGAGAGSSWSEPSQESAPSHHDSGSSSDSSHDSSPSYDSSPSTSDSSPSSSD